MKLSIIISNYNSEETLPALIESIPKNDNLEIIVVDDFSTDGSFAKFSLDEKYSHVNFVVSEYKGYAGAARNKGIKLSKGEYVLFADCDDKLSSKFIDNILERKFEKDVYFFKFNSFVYETGKQGTRSDYFNTYVKTGGKTLLYGLNSPCGKIINKNFIENNNIFFNEVIASNDVMFCTRLAVSNPTFEIINEVGYLIGESTTSLTASVTIEKNLTRLEQKIESVQMIIAHGKINKFKYFFTSSSLHKYEADALELNSEKFNNRLLKYKNTLGIYKIPAIVGSKIIKIISRGK